MPAQMDCPICMDCIEPNKNCVTTECGHSFHTNCLMQNVAHNGFGCPYCRSAMAQETDEDEEDDDVSYSDDEDEEEDEDYAIQENYVLRGLRFFWNNVYGDEHDEEDEEDEDDEEDEPNVPPADFVAKKLQEQGVTFDQLVKLLLLEDHMEYGRGPEVRAIQRLDNEIFGKIRTIVSNYTPSEQVDTSITLPNMSDTLRVLQCDNNVIVNP